MFSKLIGISQNPKLKNIIDVDMTWDKGLSKYSNVELHLFILPYSRAITTKDISFFPFHDYQNISNDNDSSVYSEIGEASNKFFGVFLALIITLVFYKFKPTELLSVQSIIAIFGSYTLGKDFWKDIDEFLVRLTGRLKLRYIPQQYELKLNNGTTLYNITKVAEENRYGIPSIYPNKLTYQKLGNTITTKMFFRKNNYKNYLKETTHVMSMRINPDITDELIKQGFIINTKFSVNKKFLFFSYDKEFFQSINKTKTGYFDKDNNWVDKVALRRQTLNIGRFKFYFKDKMVNNIELINQK